MMAGLLLFILGIVLGIVVDPWFFLLCVPPVLITAYLTSK
jgi:hypothetical protein